MWMQMHLLWQFTVKFIECTRGSHCHTESPNTCTEVKMYKQHHLLPIRSLLIVVGNTELYLQTKFLQRITYFHLGYKNQWVYAVSGTICFSFWEKYRTHKYSVGRTYSCWMLNWWCITWPVGFKIFKYCVKLEKKDVTEKLYTTDHNTKHI